MLLTTGNTICIFLSFYMYLWICSLHASPCLLPLKVRRLFAWVLFLFHLWGCVGIIPFLEFIGICKDLYVYAYSIFYPGVCCWCTSSTMVVMVGSNTDLVCHVFKMWFFSLQRSRVEKSVMAYQRQGRCVALCGQLIGLNLMKWCYQCALFAKVG